MFRPRFAQLCACCVMALAAGCESARENSYKSVAAPPTVALVKPQSRTIVRTVGQPSFVEAYERTSIYPKLIGYIKDWVADIGDKVHKDDVLATLFVPELVEDFATKDATVKLDEERVRLAEQVVKVAAADVDAAKSRLEEARKILGKYEAEVERWESEVKRLQREVNRGVVDPQILLESTNQLKSNTAAREAAKAAIDTANSELAAAQETLAKDQIDVGVAKADLAVATSEWRRTGALMGYLTLRAPFDGVVFERNANTFDFVLPTTGDPTANRRAPDVSSAGAAPVYVIDRTDIVRVFVDIPERDANFVHAIDLRLIPALKSPGELPTRGNSEATVARSDEGLYFRVFDATGKMTVDSAERELGEKSTTLDTLKRLLDEQWASKEGDVAPGAGPVVWSKIPGAARQLSPIVKQKTLALLAELFGRDRVSVGTPAHVLIRAYQETPIEGTVTRTSWALNVTSRTLRAEIDLPNPDARILPGMYAYADVVVMHSNVPALPDNVIERVGDRTYGWVYQEGKSRRVELHTGVSDGEWVEITAVQKPSSDAAGSWSSPTGNESFIQGDLSTLVDGGSVMLKTEK